MSAHYAPEESRPSDVLLVATNKGRRAPVTVPHSTAGRGSPGVAFKVDSSRRLHCDTVSNLGNRMAWELPLLPHQGLTRMHMPCEKNLDR